MFFLPDAALQHFQSQRISGPDIPLVRCHIHLEVPLSLVLGSSHCQSWGELIFQIGFLQLVPFLLDKFFLPGYSFFHLFVLRNTLLSCIHLGLDRRSIQIVHSVFFFKLVQGLKAILNFHSISPSYRMAGAKIMPVETGTFGSFFPLASKLRRS